MTKQHLEYYHSLATNNGIYFNLCPSLPVGCFYCLEQYKAEQIKEYTHGKKGYVEFTAVCKCGIDSVVPLIGTVEENDKLLQQMYDYWFGL